jgi:hypothetical protein
MKLFLNNILKLTGFPPRTRGNDNLGEDCHACVFVSGIQEQIKRRLEFVDWIPAHDFTKGRPCTRGEALA